VISNIRDANENPQSSEPCGFSPIALVLPSRIELLTSHFAQWKRVNRHSVAIGLVPVKLVLLGIVLYAIII